MLGWRWGLRSVVGHTVLERAGSSLSAAAAAGTELRLGLWGMGGLTVSVVVVAGVGAGSLGGVALSGLSRRMTLGRSLQGRKDGRLGGNSFWRLSERLGCL